MAYGYWYNRSGLGNIATGLGDMLPRGSRIAWSGVVTGSLACLGFSPCRQSELESLLRGQGFGIERLDWNYDSLFSNTYRLNFVGTVPSAYANANDAFSIIKGDVWNVYEEEPTSISQSILNVPYVDQSSGQTVFSGAPTYNMPSDAGACGQKSGLDWVSCQLGLDTTAQRLGLGVGAGVTLALVGLLVAGLVVLKK